MKASQSDNSKVNMSEKCASHLVAFSQKLSNGRGQVQLFKNTLTYFNISYHNDYHQQTA